MNDRAPATAASELSEDDRSRTAAQQEMAQANPDARTVSVVILATLAVFYTLDVAAGILLPLLFAVVLNLLLAPAKRLLTDRLRLPSALAAAVLMLLLFCVVCGVAALISVPASTWIAKAPQSLPQLQQRLGFLSGPIEFMRHGADQLQHALQQPQPAGQQTVAVQEGSGFGGVGMTILEGTRAALGQLLTLAVVLFFLLASGDSLLRRLVEILPTFGDKRRVVEIAEQIEQNVSGYLLTITGMNLLVGIANGLSIWVLGLPDPLLWGTLAFLLNYIPIIGPFAGMGIFFFVGLFSSDSLVLAVLPPAIYLFTHVVEGEWLTPMLLARRFTLNPVLVIVSLFFWDWMWGVPGAFLAVPLLAIVKIVADRVTVLAPLGHLLGGPTAGSAQPEGEPKQG